MRPGTGSEEHRSLSEKKKGVMPLPLKHVPSPTSVLKLHNTSAPGRSFSSRKKVSNRKSHPKRKCRSAASCGCITGIRHLATKELMSNMWGTNAERPWRKMIVSKSTWSPEFLIRESGTAWDTPARPGSLLKDRSSNTRPPGHGVSCPRTKPFGTSWQKWNSSLSRNWSKGKEYSSAKTQSSEEPSSKTPSRGSTTLAPWKCICAPHVLLSLTDANFWISRDQDQNWTLRREQPSRRSRGMTARIWKNILEPALKNTRPWLIR